MEEHRASLLRQPGVTRRLVVAFALLFALPVGTLPGARALEPVPTLAVGDSAFWDGPFIESAGIQHRAADDELCRRPTTNTYGCAFGTAHPLQAAVFFSNRLDNDLAACGPAVSCIDYGIQVSPGGARLRVALDHPSGRDVIGIELYAPDGTFVGSNAPFAAGTTVEVYAHDPAPGLWIARAVLYDVVGSAFRMRAKLDADPPSGGQVRPLLPNLQMIPPLEVGFVSCQLSETLQHGAGRCLRFSIGPRNVGEGPLELVIEEPVSLTGTNHQRVHYSDGSTVDRPAGRYAWHAAHGHYHHLATADLELFLVNDPSTGAMQQVGAGPKQGFCLADQVIAEWNSFDQDEQWSGTGSCTSVVDPPVGTRMGLTRGWGDVYPFWVEGNYVEFGDHSDGLYVVRATSDPFDDILETNESDNVAYAYVQVTGDSLTVLERGRGASPWDLAKVVVHDTRPPTS